jgi:hypothetical protein
MWMTNSGGGCMSMSDDRPDPESRVILKDGRMGLNWRTTNVSATSFS